MTESSAWARLTEENPDHSAAYVRRWHDLAAQGMDLVGEARLLDAMLPRGTRVLDAGCGQGRIAGHLARAGHDVVGVDLDPVLIAAADEENPGPRYLVSDLAELDLPARGVEEPFAALVCAGNVMTFLAPSTRREVLSRLRVHLVADGRAVIGFGAGRGYEFDEFLADAQATGWAEELLLSAWDVRPFTPESEFLVAVLRPA
ncbi:bifunctional 2-polyprenyl-6-hydroxyphenol methylase/3-demethylubiquinol 3-O-methyltransferase UbiG [Blastococcus sp. LR1]|uniref:class I SAM-dependent methyltransferase n=1 Tax=Blastococcus sp. LR1 TaxID=2877000 RepID=UPI001CCB9B73|nr:class I SAM-dependent methyltransferase [Blastococcus sp. LR1]MCA0147107.1 class I SAM-dependent methyltransferase [Blastococcus sp. LR1]